MRRTLVLQQHFPDVPLHDDILTLDLVEHGEIGDGDRLDTVIITTPCTDVSPRGAGAGQDGMVCVPSSVYVVVLCTFGSISTVLHAFWSYLQHANYL